MVREVPLGGRIYRGLVALVDDEDYDLVMQFNWHARRWSRVHGPDNFYAVRAVSVRVNGKRVSGKQRMHSLLMPGVPQVDHRDGDGLNNQHSNLRPATNSQNRHNQKFKIASSSRFFGVHWMRNESTWVASVRVDGRKIHGGCFQAEEDAAKAHDELALAHYGEYARLNFPRVSAS